jgi:hypothetical protein
MKSNLIIIAAAIALCAAAFYCGRVSQRTQAVVRVQPVLPRTTALSSFVAPPDFGQTIYRDLASLSFADLYEGLRTAPPSTRREWLHQIEQMDESPKKLAAFCAFFRALIQADPNAACDLILQVGRHRGPAIHSMVYAAPPAAMSRLVETLLKLPHAARDFNLTPHVEVAIDEWAEVDPEAVLRFVEQHKREADDPDESKLSFQECGASVIQAWAGIDAQAAFEWLNSHPQELSDMGWGPWLDGLFTADPDAAIKYAFAHLEDDKRIADSLSGFALNIFEENETKARSYVQELPTAAMRRDALESIARQVGFSDSYPADTVANLLTEFPVSEWPEQLGDVMRRWVMDSSDEFIDWMAHQSAEIQARFVERFPTPDLDLPEPGRGLLLILQLPPSDVRTKLL